MSRVPDSPSAARPSLIELSTTIESMESPEQKNYAAISRLEALLEEMRKDPSKVRETEAIREIGFEIAIAIREVGAMLINVGWEQTFASGDRFREARPDERP